MRRTRGSIKESARAASKQVKPKREYSLESCPRERITRGFSDDDYACSECHSIDECKSNTLERILKVMKDLNRKIFDDNFAFEFHDDEGSSYWNLVKQPSCIDGKWLDELREQIKTNFQTMFEYWEDYPEEDGNDTFQENVEKLHKATLSVLDNIWPEWKKWTGQFIDKKHVLDTKNRVRLNLCLRIPFFIMDSYMNKMSNPAWKVFCYIARCATFDPAHNHFGRCNLSYEEIQEWTEVKTISKYVKELMDMGLIELTQQKIRNFSTGGVGTINTFTVKWFGEFKKLGVNGSKKRSKR